MQAADTGPLRVTMGAEMPIGTTVAITIAISAALTTGAFFVGRASAPDDVEQVTGLVEAQGRQMDAVLDGVADIASQTGRPIVIDAEIRDALARTPPSCGVNGDPSSLECLVSQCWQYGQSSANRPACLPFETELLRQKAAGCPVVAPPDVDQ